MQAVKRFITYTLVLFSLILVSCSEYNEILKSTDNDKKYEYAIKYYNEKDYFKAEALLKDLLSIYKGTKRAEEIYYYYAYCHYGLQDYDYAAFHFKNYVKNFSKSDKTEEMHYMIAMCYTKLSPESSLDQTYTLKAIQEFQLFLDKYPYTERKEDVNKKIDELRDKLEQKAYDLAYLYYKVEDFKAAIIAFKNVLMEYPDINNAEEIRFYIVDASYKLAKNSVENKKEERLANTLDAIKEFRRRHKDSQYNKEIENIEKQTKKELTLLQQ